MESFGDKVTAGVIGLVVLAGVALLGYPVVKTISAPGTVDYCYVETERHTVPNQADVVLYEVFGFRPWRSDRRIATNLANMDQVREAAAKYGCQLR